jgi:hypothetical protein
MWMVRLSGPKPSLEKLGRVFAEGRHRVSEEEGHRWLTSSELAACDWEREAWDVAERIVDRINRAAMAVESEFEPVRIGALIKVDHRGAKHCHFVARPGTGRILLRAPTIGPSHTQLVALQEREERRPDSAVTRALEQWSLPEQTPTSLNNVLEILREDTSGGDPDNGRAWKKMAELIAPLVGMLEPQLHDELRRCRESLHNYASMGPLARHAGSRPVRNPMNLGQAKAFVHRLLLAWLGSKV